MALVLRTTSQIISHYEALEDRAAENYRRLAEAHPEHMEVFTGLADENAKHRDRVIRAYRMGVTDAFEVGFTRNPVDPASYELTEVDRGTLAEAVEASIDNEEKIIQFCLEAAKSSGELLPDLPDTFEWLIKRKKKRVERLRSLT
ncbi:hypothetical protein JXL21_11380 [Candidatus Bathyarchaeota archaeon]|nr:hypothetical protein [Candidatus Bathyarchaeota archaeon]